LIKQVRCNCLVCQFGKLSGILVKWCGNLVERLKNIISNELNKNKLNKSRWLSLKSKNECYSYNNHFNCSKVLDKKIDNNKEKKIRVILLLRVHNLKMMTHITLRISHPVWIPKIICSIIQISWMLIRSTDRDGYSIILAVLS